VSFATSATSAGSSGSGPNGKITRDDIASKLRDISGQTTEKVEATKAAATWAIGAAVGAAVLAAYLLGRRKGRKGRSVIEIRRV